VSLLIAHKQFSPFILPPFLVKSKLYQILEAIDTPRGFVEMLYHGIISDRTRPVEEWLTGIESVTKEEIVKVAKNIELDTIYFLQGTEGE